MNMKKILIILFGILCVYFTVSCSRAEAPSDNNVDIPVSSTAYTPISNLGNLPENIKDEVFEENSVATTENATDDTTESNTVDAKGDTSMEDLIKLVEGNKKCIFELFILDMLPCDGYYSGSDNKFVQVRSDEFPTFADLEQYVQSIYCIQEANRLLYGNDGQALYLDIDGVLYTDIRLHAGMGYYVNWDDYEIVIRNQQVDICDFDMVTTEEDIMNDGVSEIILSFQAVLENDAWKLKKMVY
jgi:hypothetical protein